MRIFKDSEFNKPCPICGKKEAGDAALVGIFGTEDGYNIEAELFHVDCLDLKWIQEHNTIVQQW